MSDLDTLIITDLNDREVRAALSLLADRRPEEAREVINSILRITREGR